MRARPEGQQPRGDRGDRHGAIDGAGFGAAETEIERRRPAEEREFAQRAVRLVLRRRMMRSGIGHLMAGMAVKRGTRLVVCVVRVIGVALVGR